MQLFTDENKFEQSFAQCSLSPADFTHEAHLYLAWIHISKYGLEKAIVNICSQLKAFTVFNGAADKYNETLTVAAVYAVHHFMQRSSARNFDSLLLQFPALKNNLQGLLAQHYGFDIYHSAEAKQKYLQPDLLRFL